MLGINGHKWRIILKFTPTRSSRKTNRLLSFDADMERIENNVSDNCSLLSCVFVAAESVYRAVA